MKPFRKHLAIAIDGGGIQGAIVTKALSMVEEQLGTPLHERTGLTAGTSTGSIIAAGLALGLEAKRLNELYLKLGNEIFHPSLRSLLWPLFNYRYPNQPLKTALYKYFGNRTDRSIFGKPVIRLTWSFRCSTSSRTARALSSHTKNREYADWPVVKAVMASAAAPTYFPSIDGRYIDGGVGSYGDPCYLAAYEIRFGLKWNLEETTLISIGTGRNPNMIKPGEVNHFLPLRYINPILDAFQVSAADQQVDLVQKLFNRLDFRRFQVDLKTVIQMDAPCDMPELICYGEELGKMMLNDKTDRAMDITPETIPGITKSTSRRQTNKSGSPPRSRSRTPTKSARARQKR